MTPEADDQRPLARFLDISKSYNREAGSVQVLQGLTFELRRNEVLGLIGPSGVGKTTVLNLLAGEISPDGGSIKWAHASKKSNLLPMIFQDDAVFPWMRTADNVAFSKTVSRGNNRKIIREEAVSFLSSLNLGELADLWPAQLSGGMRKRVELARAFFCHPRAILLDEPFSMLDTITRSQVHIWFLDQLLQNNTSAILVSHDIDEVIKLSDRILVLGGAPASIRKELLGLRGRGRESSDSRAPLVQEIKQALEATK